MQIFIAAILFTLTISNTPFFDTKAFAAADLVEYGKAGAVAFNLKSPIRVLGWNIHKVDTPETYRHIERMAKDLDIMILQESMMDPLAEKFFTNNTIGFETYGAISFATKKDASTGVSTSARAKAISALPVRSHETEPVLNTSKMILLTVYKIKDSSDTLMVANIHGLNFVPNWKFEVQLKQLEAELAKHSGPILLAGDFNTHNVPKALMLGQMAKRLNLEYVWMEKDRGLRMHLDHMFVRGFNVRATELLSDVRSSDHFPIWAELEFK